MHDEPEHFPMPVDKDGNGLITKEELKQWLIDNPKCVYSGREVVFKIDRKSVV